MLYFTINVRLKRGKTEQVEVGNYPSTPSVVSQFS